VKSTLNGDLRRFTVDETITFAQLNVLLQNLYRIDTSTLGLHYVDEEGDDISITSDIELSEAVRVAVTSKPSILRVNLNREVVKVEVKVEVPSLEEESGEVGKEGGLEGSSHCVVYIQGVPKIIKLKEPTLVDQKEEKKDNQLHNEKIMNMITKAKEQSTTKQPQTTTTTPTTVLSVPYPVLSNSVPVEDILLNINDAKRCSELSESIAKLCLQDSTAIFNSTSALCDAISQESRSLSKATSLNIHNLPFLSPPPRLLFEDSKACMSECDALVASTMESSKMYTDSMRALQNESIMLMREMLLKDVEDVQAQIRIATKNM